MPYDQYGQWYDDQVDPSDPYNWKGIAAALNQGQQDPMQMLLDIAMNNGGSAAKNYKGTDPYYFADQASQNVKNLYGLTGINPIEMAYPLGEKGTVPYTPQADYFRQTSDPDLQAIYNDIDNGASMAQVQAGLINNPDFTEEEIKAYTDSAKQYEKAKRTDQIKTAQYDESRRYTDPLGMESNPDYQNAQDSISAYEDQFKTGAFAPLNENPTQLVNKYRTVPGKDRWQVRNGYQSNQQLSAGNHLGSDRNSSTPVRDKSNRVRVATAPRQQFAGTQKVSNPYEADFNRQYNERAAAVAKFTGTQMRAQLQNIPQQRPTPGNQNFQARLAAVRALLGQ